MDLEKLRNVSDKYVSKFNKIANELVMREVSGTDDENKKNIAVITARDMAMGAMVKRGEHILTGIAIGTLGSVLTFGVIRKIKKRNNKK